MFKDWNFDDWMNHILLGLSILVLVSSFILF